MKNEVVASAPAKVILIGGKGVNWGFPAIVAAVDIRTRCTVTPTEEPDSYRFAFQNHSESGNHEDLQRFKREIDGLRDRKDYDGISAIAKSDFFAPVRYVLGHVGERTKKIGLEIRWASDIPSGSGLGSGAAASASMVTAVMHAHAQRLEPKDIAWLAWQGDIIAHGGVGTGLDSGGSSLGGLVRYSLTEGPSSLTVPQMPSLVVGDTLVRASTAASNTTSRNWLAEHPMRYHLLQEMGLLVEGSQVALAKSDLERVGHFMNLSQLIKEKLGMSIPEIETLIEAALDAGALGAKISGKGGGGIIVALVPPGKERAVAEAIDAAGGKGIVPEVGVPGARIEPSTRSNE